MAEPAFSANKRILIIRNAFSYDFGGGERFPVQLARELTKYGYSPLVVTRSPQTLAYAESQNIPAMRGWWWSKQNWSGKSVILLPLYIVWQLVLLGWYLQLILRKRPSIVHIQSKDDFIAATLAGRMLGKKVIWTDHADLKYIFANHRVWYKNPVGKIVYWCSKLADYITLVSQSEKQLIETELGHPVSLNYQVVHNGVNDTSVTPRARSSEETGKYIYCATSRLVAAKGIGELIDAFTAVHTAHPDTMLWLVGAGPEEDRFRGQASAVPAIKFIGHSDEALSYVASCDAFVHPSYHEGFSLSLVEAAMLAKPIIACNVGGNPEIIQDNVTGLLISPQNTQDLAAAMTALYTDRQLAATLGTHARSAYEKDFRFETIVRDTFIPIYEKTSHTV